MKKEKVIKHIKLTIDEFEKKYKPKKNHLDDNASFNEWGYETYGDEMAYVNKIHAKYPNRVWTVTDCDGAMVIGDGLHFVNRMLYVITKVPFGDDESISVVDREEEEQYLLGLTVKNKAGEIIYQDSSGGFDWLYNELTDEDGDGIMDGDVKLTIDEGEYDHYQMEAWLKERGYTYEFAE